MDASSHGFEPVPAPEPELEPEPEIEPLLQHTKGANDVIRRVHDGDRTLVNVNLHDKDVDDEALGALAEALRRNSHVRSNPGNASQPHQIILEAAVDNNDPTEALFDLRLAPWS